MSPIQIENIRVSVARLTLYAVVIRQVVVLSEVASLVEQDGHLISGKYMKVYCLTCVQLS